MKKNITIFLLVSLCHHLYQNFDDERTGAIFQEFWNLTFVTLVLNSINQKIIVFSWKFYEKYFK